VVLQEMNYKAGNAFV